MSRTTIYTCDGCGDTGAKLKLNPIEFGDKVKFNDYVILPYKRTPKVYELEICKACEGNVKRILGITK